MGVSFRFFIFCSGSWCDHFLGQKPENLQWSFGLDTFRHFVGLVYCDSRRGQFARLQRPYSFFFVCFKLGGCLGVRFGNGALGGHLRVKNPWVFNSEKDLERKKPSPIITSSLLEVFWKVKYWGGDGGWRKMVEDGWLMICSNWNIYEQIILENNPFFLMKNPGWELLCVICPRVEEVWNSESKIFKQENTWEDAQKFPYQGGKHT